LAVLVALIPWAGGAQDSWLDGGQDGWNAPGMAVPAAASPPTSGSAQCHALVRPAETVEDAAVAEQGWRLYSSYQRGWGITLVGGFLNFDAQCRPVPHQHFVFVDGVFAGTLAPQAMVPRTDGSLINARIGGPDSVYAVYDRYGLSDPLCCPSNETAVMFTIERTPDGPVVTLDSAPDPAHSSSQLATPMTTLASAEASPGIATYPVCVGLGGDALSLVHWTADEIAAQEARTGPVVRAHSATGACTDPAGLPVLRDSVASFSWVCSRTYDGSWYGPAWTADIYRSETDVPPDPAIGGCPLPRDQTIPLPPDLEQAAATAVYLSQLEAAGDLDTLYAWLHPEAQAVVPKPAVVGWYTNDLLPWGPEPISVTSADFAEWTWQVTGASYPRTAEIAYEQRFADGSVESDVIRLVQADQGVWRWFFGRNRAFVDEQIARFDDPETG
jgi:hypothetical protein